MNKKIFFIISLMIGICFVLSQSEGFAQQPAATLKAEEKAVQPKPAVAATPAPTVSAKSAVELQTEETTPMETASDLEAEQEAEELDIPVAEAEAVPLRQKTESLIKEEITQVGSFEVDHPETGDLLELQFASVDQAVVQVVEGEYMIHANFKDAKGAAYGVDVYLEEMGKNEYEIVDAIVESIDGKKIAEETTE
ncbi:MAG: hypothetical protein A3G33_01595 [Omnitrophica bacterium RIFCSPLOWO2_12_FULL_44_17]|uniref:Uncharacterized protein n=1 Tax=Candidatus Danuiimicrobium aquiferis TaxID=1801832 RepID=A0A1G1KV23_9BACT|nr:MAG: hypothetical protein A3B72_00830 [Omnitrophica bacterium RIFCSPHIGHO2_02_FULL_45_28]OGW92503.1 MAG: hypothetical protein A3E74_09290 [Omnitrophica bacterium RIFCSPHIGHO2_12_FULL_44_12]OGW96808.1 MAG: hypothetical protein A3G33_01595 [Omnitrophica bacterium RIFCSPLOWO2_12_FULL_44_17]OGX03810.1 MAG: hypothetical protein A3J12_09485 [Omnitrophica bacterium RIFCSPLOWO2_02_FULL_44_11]